MALEVYYPQDIRNVLLAAEQASNTALMVACGKENDFSKGYWEGYRAALTTIALAFGLLQPETCPDSHRWQPTFLAAPVPHNGHNGASR